MEVLAWTQIGSLVIYIGAVFAIYKLLVEQKDATIQVLKEKAENMKDKADILKEKSDMYKGYAELFEKQLKEVKETAPDLLAKRLKSKNELLQEELFQLCNDQEKNLQLISEKEVEINEVRCELRELKKTIDRAKELMTDFFCPHCEAPMVTREFFSESVEYMDRDVDIDHEIIKYECGYELEDGQETVSCSTKDNQNNDALF